jgi:uncharacterized membrane protein (DUF4010 family)
MVFIESEIYKLFLSLLLGAIIGSQREIWQKKKKFNDFAGFRTFSLISLFGFLTAFLDNIYNSNFFVILGFIMVILFDLFSYYRIYKVFPKRTSVITQVCFLLTYLIGIFIYLNYFYLSLTIAILVSTILFLGEKLHNFAYTLSENEIFATLKFAIISVVILPLLPNKNYTLLDMPVVGNFFSSQSLIPINILKQIDVFNFYKIWLVVIFISGISYVGYILMKTIGSNKGIALTGFLGGLVSSTAVTVSFAQESKKLKYLSIPLALGVVIACSTMFFRMLLEVVVVNSSLFLNLFFILSIMGAIGFVISYFLLKKIKLNHIKDIKVESPFQIMPALKFSLFFLFIIFLSKLFSILFGDKGVYFVAFFSGFSDVDAITLSLSTLALNGNLDMTTAKIGILIAAFSNTLIKGFFAYYFGTRKFSKAVMISLGIILLIGTILLFF